MITKVENKFNFKEAAFILFPLILVLLIVLFFVTFKKASRDDINDYVIPSEYHGIIIKKYRHWNHNDPTIIYKSNGDTLEMSTFHWINLYESVEKGDSIYKNKGDSVLFLKKKSGKLYRVDYFIGEGYRLSKRK